MNVARRAPPSFRSFVTRRSTLCSGRPRSAFRGITIPDVIAVGPSKRSAIAEGITIVAAAPPVLVRFSRFEPVFPKGVPEIVAL